MLLGLCMRHHFQCLHKNKNKISQMQQNTTGKATMKPTEGGECGGLDTLFAVWQLPFGLKHLAKRLINTISAFPLPGLCPILFCMGQTPRQTVWKRGWLLQSLLENGSTGDGCARWVPITQVCYCHKMKFQGRIFCTYSTNGSKMPLISVQNHFYMTIQKGVSS